MTTELDKKVEKDAKKQECGRPFEPPAFLFDIEKGEGKMVSLPSFRLLKSSEY